MKKRHSSASATSNRSSSYLQRAQKHNYLDEFDAEWSGGRKNPNRNSPKDSYIPEDEGLITEMLRPLEELVRKACYVSMLSRGAGLIAQKLIKRKKPIMVRYLRKIEDLHEWVRTLDPLPLRFEPHLYGSGIKKLMKK
jgi:hypothetical protein